MTKAELVDKIAEKKPGLTRKQVEVIVNTVLDGIKDALSRKTRSRSGGSQFPGPPPPRQGRQEPEDRRDRLGAAKKSSVLQGREGNAGDGGWEDLAAPDRFCCVIRTSHVRGGCL